MEPSLKKDKIGLSLKASPLFEQLLREHEEGGSEARSSGVKISSQSGKEVTAPKDTPYAKESKKQANKEKGKAPEASSAATREGSLTRQGHLSINEVGAGSDHANGTHHIGSASTEHFQISKLNPIHSSTQDLPGPARVKAQHNLLQDPDPQSSPIPDPQRPSPIPGFQSNSPIWADEPLTQMSAAQISPFKGNNRGTGSPLLDEPTDSIQRLDEVNPDNTSALNSEPEGDGREGEPEGEGGEDEPVNENNGEEGVVFTDSKGVAAEGPVVNCDYWGEPEPEEYFENEEET